MKLFLSKFQLILFLTNVVFIVLADAALPVEVRNGFFAHRQRSREGRNLRAGSTFESDNTGSLDSKQSVSARAVVTSLNWAGAVQSPAPSGKFRSVSAQWIVPTASLPPYANGSGVWYSTVWVGIDGYSCSSAILQAGITSYVQVSSSGNVTTGASAWYEWLPNPESEISGFSVTPGDTVQVSVRAQSSSKGTAHLKNLSTRNSTSIALQAPTNSSKLCGTDAEWIVEDASSGGEFIPFSNFTTVYFHHCKAKTTTGATVHLTNTTLLNMAQNNTELATAVYKTSTELEVYYG